MKTLKSTIAIIFLTAFAFAFSNCTQEDPEPAPTFNYSTFTDSRDGRTYKYIKIGDQEWMAENLSYKTTSGSWYPEGYEEYAKYGRLYTWDAALLAVPEGWHLPTDDEWKELEMFLGMSQTDADGIGYRGKEEGNKLKNNTGWPDNYNGINEVGFAALPGGCFSNSGYFNLVEWRGYWWSATESDNVKAWIRFIAFANSYVFRNTSYKEDAYSVRCIKD